MSLGRRRSGAARTEPSRRLSACPRSTAWAPSATAPTVRSNTWLSARCRSEPRCWLGFWLPYSAQPRGCAATERLDRTGFSFDAFLEEEGIREEVETVAVKRALRWLGL